MLNYLIVEDDATSCYELGYALRCILPKESSNILVANNAEEAIAIAKNTPPPIYVAFLDINLPGMNGLELAKVFEEQELAYNIIFVTAHPEYSIDAWNTEASGFMVKPVSQAQLESCLNKLRKPLQEVKPIIYDDMLQFRCFGDFEITYQGKPVHFIRRKSKDFLAYLIDHKGEMVPTSALRAALWDINENTKSKAAYIRMLASDIRTSLAEIGQSEVFLHERDYYSLDATKIRCDYYDYLSGDAVARRIFHLRGEYMSQYTWAQATLNTLLEDKDN